MVRGSLGEALDGLSGPRAASRARSRIKRNEGNKERVIGSDTPWAVGPANLIEGDQRPVTTAPPFWVLAVWGFAGTIWRGGCMWGRCVGAIVDQLVLERFLADLGNVLA